MEATAAAWGAPSEIQLTAATNWSGDDDAQVWAPATAGGLPSLEYASIVDIFGSSSCSLQPYYYAAPASSCGGLGQHYDYSNSYYYNSSNYTAAAPAETATAAAVELSLQQVAGYYPQGAAETVGDYINRPSRLLEKSDKAFKNDSYLMKTKMHRYPAGIRGLGDSYTKPRVVAIGPYHHCGGDHLRKAEKVKHVAAHHCVTKYREIVGEKIDKDLLVRDMYNAVLVAVWNIKAGDLYDKDVPMAAGSNYDYESFQPMMFYDACFLVMYMLHMSGTPCDPEMRKFFESNGKDIAHDIMLLENQIPWQVVDVILHKCTPDPLETKTRFVARWRDGCLQDRVDDKFPPVDWDEDYRPPHLLGLLRCYIVGKGTRRSSSNYMPTSSDLETMEFILLSAGAIELAEMGIDLTANETRDLTDMGLATRLIFLAKLSMAPLCLDDLRASHLINMAAFELCTTPDFYAQEDGQDSAVCSYLLLLRMLMHREEDVQELRKNGILQGAGLTNKQALDFFASLHSLRRGPYYAQVMVVIQNYMNRRPWLGLYKFGCENWKYIVALGGALSTGITIVTKLQELKAAAH